MGILIGKYLFSKYDQQQTRKQMAILERKTIQQLEQLGLSKSEVFTIYKSIFNTHTHANTH